MIWMTDNLLSNIFRCVAVATISDISHMYNKTKQIDRNIEEIYYNGG